MQTLSWLIIGLVNAGTVNPSHLASQCSGSAQVSSSYRRLQRFFQHVTLEGDWLALAVVQLLKPRAPWVLCLDRTNRQIGRHDVNILMSAIAAQRFGIALMWTVLDKAGSSNPCERIAPMRRYLGLFGSGSIARRLADRAFIGGSWIKFLLKNNILFAIPVKKNSIIRFQDGRGYRLKTLLVIITLAMAWAYALRDRHRGDQGDRDPGPRLALQIVVPSRLRSTQKVDPTPA